jgi:glycosyltransferase involved in cell wall biosynthesis
MTKKREVSVCLPIYNQIEYVDQCVQSVLNQTRFDIIEFIIVDDVSTDGTWELLQKYAQNNPQIRLFQNSQNLGWIENFNSCINKINTPYFLFLFGDDMLSPNLIEKLNRITQIHNDKDAIFFNTLVTRNGKQSGKIIFPNTRTGKLLRAKPSAVLLKTKFIKKNNIIITKNGTDWVFILQIIQLGETITTNFLGYNCSLNPNSVSMRMQQSKQIYDQIIRHIHAWMVYDIWRNASSIYAVATLSMMSGMLVISKDLISNEKAFMNHFERIIDVLKQGYSKTPLRFINVLTGFSANIKYGCFMLALTVLYTFRLKFFIPKLFHVANHFGVS